MPDVAEPLRRIIRRRLVNPAPSGLDSEALMRWRLESLEAAVADLHASIRRLHWLVIGAAVVAAVTRVFGG